MISDDVCSPLSLGEGWGEAPIKVSAPPSSSSARINVLIVYIVHEATPKAPARAVSTVITIFKMVFQSVFIGFEFLSLVLVIGVC